MTPSHREELAPLVSVLKPAEPLRKHSTFGIGGPADYYVEVRTRKELQNLLAWAKKRGIPVSPIGQGSNLLVGDGGIRGIVLRLRGEFEKISFGGEEALVGGGAFLPALARESAEQGLAGAEFASGIPGTLGGGLMTNAGTADGWLSELVEAVEVQEDEGPPRWIPKDQISFSYRHSNLQGKLVLAAKLKLRRGSKTDIMAKIQNQLAKRAQTQPIGTYNCGSVFKNPPGDFAGRLIESAGLKGHSVGGAQVSRRHANFIENTGSATARDVRSLIEHIQKTILEKNGIRLELEVWPVGDP